MIKIRRKTTLEERREKLCREFDKLNLPPELYWENLGLDNDFMFGKVMKSVKLCRELLRRILPEIKIDKIKFPETQKIFKEVAGTTGIRLDLYTKSHDGTKVYNIEMQTTDTKTLPNRARMYHGLMNLDSFEDYGNMPTQFVIFICTFDLFQQGRHKYTFRNFCFEDKNLELNDGTVTIFLNSKGELDDVSPELKNFLDFVAGVKAEGDSFIDELQEKLNYARHKLVWRDHYMRVKMRDLDKISEGIAIGEERGIAIGEERGIAIGEERGIAIGEERGIIKGEIKKALAVAKNLIAKGMNALDIAQAVGLSVDEINSLKGA